MTDRTETTVLADITGEVYRLLEDAKVIGASSAINTLEYLHEYICAHRYAVAGREFDRIMPPRPFPRKPRTIST